MEYSENFNVIIRFNGCNDENWKLNKTFNKENKTLKIYSDIKKNSFDFNYDLLFLNEKNEKVFGDNKMERLFEISIIDGLDWVFFSYGYKKSGKTFTIKGLFNHLVLKLIQNQIDIKISKIVLDNNSIINIFKDKGKLIDNNYFMDYDKNFDYFNHEDKNQIVTILFRNLNKENNLNFTKITLIDFSLSSKYNKSFTMGNQVFETVEKNNELNNLNKCITMLNDKSVLKENIPFDNFLLTKVLKEYLIKNYLVNFIINIKDNENDIDLVLNTLAFSQRIKQIPQNYNYNRKNLLNKTTISSIKLPESSIKITESMNTKNNFKKKRKNDSDFNFNKEINLFFKNSNIISRNQELENEIKILKNCKCLKHKNLLKNMIKKHEKLLKNYQNKFDIKIKKLIEIKDSLNELINRKEKLKENNIEKERKDLYYNIESKKLNFDLIKKEKIELINKINTFKTKTINSLKNIKNKLNEIKLDKNLINLKINNKDIINNISNKIKKPSNENKLKNESILSCKTKEELINIKHFILKLNQGYINKSKNIITIKNKQLNYKEYIKYNFSKKDGFEDFKKKFENIITNLFSNKLFQNTEKYNLILLNIIRELMHSIIDNNIKNEKIEKYRINLIKKFYNYNQINYLKFLDYIKKKNSIKIIENNYIKYKNKNNPFKFKHYKIYKGKIFLMNLMEHLENSFKDLNLIIN